MTLDLDEMIVLLSICLQDVNNQKFIPDILITWLNIGQDKAVNLLNYHQITEADVDVHDAVLYGDGSFDLSGLAVKTANLDKSVNRARFKDAKFARKISLQEWSKLKNDSYVFQTTDPRYYPRGTKIFFEPFSHDDVATGSIEEGVVYVNYGYTTVTYNSVEYADGESFTGVSGVTSYTTTGTGEVIEAQEIELWYTRKPTQMAFGVGEIESGSIVSGTVYINSGYTTVTYDGSDYADGEPFVGVPGVTTYSTTGSGTVLVANTEYANIDCEFCSTNVRDIIVQIAASIGWKASTCLYPVRIASRLRTLIWPIGMSR